MAEIVRMTVRDNSESVQFTPQSANALYVGARAYVTKENGETTITCVDKYGETIAVVKDGINGVNGIDGKDGKAGIGIVDVSTTDDDRLRIVMSNGTVWESQSTIKGEQGDKGEQGEGASFNQVTATIDGGVGTPSIDLTVEDVIDPDTGEPIEGQMNVNFAFHNIKGEKGDPGEKGARGEQGAIGRAFTYEDFTPEQLANLKGEKGERGERGEKGEQGIQGIQGIQGEKGERGLQGEQGIQGIQGPQGIQGLVGPQGPQGPKGADGSEYDDTEIRGLIDGKVGFTDYATSDKVGLVKTYLGYAIQTNPTNGVITPQIKNYQQYTKLDGRAFISKGTLENVLTERLNEKVDKIDGKSLSTEDFTSAEKTKLAGIESGANNYTLPSATVSEIGGVRVLYVGNYTPSDKNDYYNILKAESSNRAVAWIPLATSSKNGAIDGATYDKIQNAVQSSDLSTVATSGSYNDLDDKPTIPATPADYIVETGTDGIWTYEKWNSGKAVAWGKYTISGYSWIAWGSYGYETNNSTLQSPPSGVFVGNPLVFPIIWDESGVVGVVSAETWKYNNGSFLVRGIRLKASSNPTAKDLSVHVEMKGKWK